MNLKSKIQNLKWLGLFVIAFVFVVAGAVAQAQQPRKFYRIGYLGVRSASLPTDDTNREAFRHELRKLGYVEGQTIAIEYRFAEGNPDRVRDLAADLVRLKVDVIVTPATLAIRAAKQATRTIPIVMAGARVDPVAAGFITSLARPGGNITGLTSIDSELQGKRLELLKEVFPRISHLALVSGRLAEQDRKEIETVGRALDIRIQFLVARSPDDLEGAFSAISKDLPNALLIGASPAILVHEARIIDFATKKRLLTMDDRSQFIEAGGLISYGGWIKEICTIGPLSTWTRSLKVLSQPTCQFNSPRNSSW